MLTDGVDFPGGLAPLCFIFNAEPDLAERCICRAVVHQMSSEEHVEWGIPIQRSTSWGSNALTFVYNKLK